MKRNKSATLMVYIHWTTFSLILLSFITILTRGIFGKGMFHDVIKTMHFEIGFLILAITIFRIIMRHFTKFPAIKPALENKLQKFIAKSVHLFLYFWLIAMPILGWSIISAAGKPIPFGLPTLISPQSSLTIEYMKNIHETLAYVGLAVIFIHINS